MARDQAAAKAQGSDEFGPWRRCIVTGVKGRRDRMLRFVLGPDGVVVPDLGAKLPGQGMWLSARADVLETARGRDGFARAARRPVMVPEDLAGEVRAGLVRRIEGLLGLARRAGQAVSGFEKARSWLAGGRAGVLIEARDGSENECRRLLGTAVLPVLRPLKAAELGAVFGREPLVHVVVAPGRLAARLVVESERLAGFSG